MTYVGATGTLADDIEGDCAQLGTLAHHLLAGHIQTRALDISETLRYHFCVICCISSHSGANLGLVTCTLLT